MATEKEYTWTDDPTVSGIADCDTDVLNDCLMHLKYENTNDAIQNMYMTGQVEKQTRGLLQLKDMAHSTFDLSKFEVVGGVNITEDGIASGFSMNNSILFDTSEIDWTKPYKIKIKCNTGTITNTDGINATLTCANMPIIRIVSYTFQFSPATTFANIGVVGAITDSARVLNNTTYYLIAEFDGENYTFSKSLDDINYTVIGTDNTMQTSLTHGGASTIGNGNGIDNQRTRVWQGSIDLKQFSITSDGVTVFTGNKTGVDIIKPDDYTVVGSPIISADGIASGFSGSNYVTQTIDFSKPFKLEFKIKTPSSVPSSVQYFLLTSTRGLVCQYSTTGVLGIKASTTAWGDDLINTTFSAQTNTEYLIEIGWTGTNYTCKINGEQIYSNSSTSQILAGGLQIGGYPSQDTSSFLGSVDLNAFKIYVDGDLVYQPCLKIPYTLSKTGSKIVDAVYRDRVKDLYEQYGCALYYTLDEENGNFTLPMGEVYGMINKNSNDTKDLQAEKMDKDLSNMNASKSAKDTIMGWMMLDWENAIDITLPVGQNNKYTAVTKCVYILFAANASRATSGLYVNDKLYGYNYKQDGYTQGVQYYVPLDVGDYFYMNSATGVNVSLIVPLKGVNL